MYSQFKSIFACDSVFNACVVGLFRTGLVAWETDTTCGWLCSFCRSWAPSLQKPGTAAWDFCDSGLQGWAPPPGVWFSSEEEGTILGAISRSLLCLRHTYSKYVSPGTPLPSQNYIPQSIYNALDMAPWTFLAFLLMVPSTKSWITTQLLKKIKLWKPLWVRFSVSNWKHQKGKRELFEGCRLQGLKSSHSSLFQITRDNRQRGESLQLWTPIGRVTSP